MKEKLGGKIMAKFVRFRAKAYRYLVDDNSEDENQKAQKSVLKRKLKFENYKIYLEPNKVKDKIKYLQSSP